MFSPVWSQAMVTLLGFAFSPQGRLRSARSALATFTLGLLQVLWLSSLSSCAATKSGDRAPSQKRELYCGSDDDCVVLESDFSDCCGADGRYPYVLSRGAADQMTSLWETRCRGVPCGEMLYSRSGPRGSDFVAVCSSHICEMKPKEARPKWQLPEQGGQHSRGTLPNKPLQRSYGVQAKRTGTDRAAADTRDPFREKRRRQ